MMHSDHKQDAAQPPYGYRPDRPRCQRGPVERRVAGFIVAAAVVIGRLCAQDVNPLPDQRDPNAPATTELNADAPPPDALVSTVRARPKNGGLQISNISAYTAYYSNFLPNGSAFQIGAPTLPWDVGLGGSITLDWTRLTGRTTFSMSYTPSYTASWRYSSLDSLNHLFSLNLSRKVTPRWNFGLSAGASVMNYEQSLFAASVFSNVASTPANFSDLANGLLASRFGNNPQLGVVLTNSPIGQSPLSTLVYGYRMFTSSARLSGSYLFSPRLTISFAAGGNRAQQLSQTLPSNTQNHFVVPKTTSADGNVSVSYSRSPVTQIGGVIRADWITSQLFTSYTTTSEMTLGRTFERRWLVQLHGGVGVTDFTRQIAGTETEPRPVFGGTLAYKTRAQTFLGSFDRVSNDIYGVGASTSSTATASWQWRRPGNSWWLTGNFGWQQLTGNALANTTGWQASGGFHRLLGRHAVVFTEYAYLNYSGGFQGTVYHSSQSAMRLVLTWTPEPALAQ